jgi:hypothetical protein
MARITAPLKKKYSPAVNRLHFRGGKGRNPSRRGVEVGEYFVICRVSAASSIGECRPEDLASSNHKFIFIRWHRDGGVLSFSHLPNWALKSSLLCTLRAVVEYLRDKKMKRRWPGASLKKDKR